MNHFKSTPLINIKSQKILIKICKKIENLKNIFKEIIYKII
jgi:hypothetical protein